MIQLYSAGKGFGSKVLFERGIVANINHVLEPDLASQLVREFGLEAKVIVVGESPTREEAEAGRPFVGHAGGRLRKVLDRLGLSRSEVYLTNAVKCVLGRKPADSEIRNCRPWLMREMALVGKGKPVVGMGKMAIRGLGR